jgi:hypothetical protein
MSQLAQKDTVDACIAHVKKLRRTKVVGPERATPVERRAWDKTRYDTLKEVERELTALKAKLNPQG